MDSPAGHKRSVRPSLVVGSRSLQPLIVGRQLRVVQLELLPLPVQQLEQRQGCSSCTLVEQLARQRMPVVLLQVGLPPHILVGGRQQQHSRNLEQLRIGQLQAFGIVRIEQRLHHPAWLYRLEDFVEPVRMLPLAGRMLLLVARKVVARIEGLRIPGCILLEVLLDRHQGLHIADIRRRLHPRSASSVVADPLAQRRWGR